MKRIVTTQGELDAAIAEGVSRIIIDSPAGVWITIGGGYVEEVQGCVRVANGGSVGRVDNGGRVGRVDNGGRVERAIKASTIHLHGGTLTHAAPTVAVFVHTADSTWSGGTLIDLRDLDLTDVETWHTWTDAHVDATRDKLIVTNVSSEDNEGILDRDGAITIGCFSGDVAKLRELIIGEKWPSGADAERREKYRPRLLAFADLCDAQIRAWAEYTNA